MDAPKQTPIIKSRNVRSYVKAWQRMDVLSRRIDRLRERHRGEMAPLASKLEFARGTLAVAQGRLNGKQLNQALKAIEANRKTDEHGGLHAN